MLFNSYSYLLFLFIAVVTIYNSPVKVRVYVYLIFSIVFYAMWRVDFTALVLVCAAISYFSAKGIVSFRDHKIKKLYLIGGLALNLGVLIFFKYSYFLYHSFWSITSSELSSDLALNIILPLGISFYTFQAISYPIDIFRKVTTPAKNYWVFLSFVMFWPQIIAGPILRKNEVIPQLLAHNCYVPENIIRGIKRIVQGLFKKVVLADTIAIVVDASFSSTNFVNFTAFDIWVLAFLFGFQIYFDFSGYSDIALGSARLFGITFPENFNFPYLAKSPRDFWKRWHISLSSWVRDYLYLPLIGEKFHTKSEGGIAVATKKGKPRYIWALFLSWFIMGLWHGAEWKFALWGVYHAIWIWVYRNSSFIQRLSFRMPLMTWLITLLITMGGWISFRADSFSDAIFLYSKLLNPFEYTLLNHQLSGMYYLWCVIILSGIWLSYIYRKWIIETGFSGIVKYCISTFCYALITVAIIIYLKPVEQFIYFQF